MEPQTFYETAVRDLLLRHAARYPEAQPQDYMKLLYQSAFGCEHLVADPSAAADYIRHEAQTMRPCQGDTVEMLAGPYARVHLDVLNTGLSADTLARLFTLSARHEEAGPELLQAGLKVLCQLLRSGELPLNEAETQIVMDDWQKRGYPPCHHSEHFRQCYAPSYRLIHTDYLAALPLLAAIDAQLRGQGRALVAIDGCCASGKSTLGKLLQTLYGCTLFHMDDFFLRPEQRTPERYATPGENVDHERFLQEVLLPAAQGQPVQYRRFDCCTMTVQPAVTVEPTPLTVVEGSYSLHPELRDIYTLRVFLTIAPGKQQDRLLKREGADRLKQFNLRWIPLEKAYHDAYYPQQYCEVII